MARDYAKYNSKRRVSDNKNRYPDIFIIITLLVIIFVTSFWVYNHKLKGAFSQNSKLSHAIANLEAFFHHKKPEKDISLLAQAQPQLRDQQEEVRFDFYNELQNMQVSLPAAEEKTSKSTATKATMPKTTAFNLPKKTAAPTILSSMDNKTDKKSGYQVHLGRFTDMNTASEMRISLLLVGIDAEIVKIGNEYHLRQGLYSSLAQAKEMQKKLQLKGFDSTVAEA